MFRFTIRDMLWLQFVLALAFAALFSFGNLWWLFLVLVGMDSALLIWGHTCCRICGLLGSLLGIAFMGWLVWASNRAAGINDFESMRMSAAFGGVFALGIAGSLCCILRKQAVGWIGAVILAVHVLVHVNLVGVR